VGRIPVIARALDGRIDQGLREVADDIAQDAKQRAPVNTGSLREAIHVEKDDGYMVIAGDDDVFYGHFVEFGTTETGARPFLLPALEGKRFSAAARVAAKLRELI
jgi:HK97 gp10 family phage protein